MKLEKRLLLGSAAGLASVVGAQAADLPVRKAAPVEYVRVCNAYGAGFFYIPGTDTCLRVGGRARFEYQYTSNRGVTPQIGTGAVANQVNNDSSSFRTLGRLSLDARTQTAYGTLRAFVRFELGYSSGGLLVSGSQQRFGTAFPGLGNDTFGRAQTNVNLEKAFVQFAGFTAGRAASFYDFYAHDAEFAAVSATSDLQSTNVFAYTYTFGEGWSATISAEDPLSRRQPAYTNANFNGVTATPSGQTFTNFGGVFVQSVPLTFFTAGPLAGLPSSVANLDVIQRDRLPDFVGVLRYDAPWGAAQLSGASHELFFGKYVNTQAVTYDAGGNPVLGAASTALATTAFRPQPKAEYGYAVQGGLKVNLPQIAAGDTLWLTAAYSQGAQSYVGPGTRLSGSENLATVLTRLGLNTADSFVGADGKTKLTESWSVAGAYLHFWAPEWRSAVFGSYSEINYGKAARNGNGPANLIGIPVTPAGLLSGFGNSLNFNTILRDYSISTIGTNLIWSPVRDLDIGVEGVYQRFDLKSGRATDGNKALGTLAGAGTASAVAGIPLKSVKDDDIYITRIRVQRDF